MKYTMKYYIFDKEENDVARDHNRDMLAELCKGIDCLDATNFQDSAIPDDVKKGLQSRLNPDEQFGTVEQYANGYFNVFVRIISKDKSGYSLDGFFKVWVE